MKKLLVSVLLLILLTTTAVADTTLSGTVVASETVTVLCPANGTLASVAVQAGDRVNPGDTVATLLTTTIYANETGTVKIFGSEGASLENIAGEYGAVLYILPDAPYSVSANTKFSYEADSNKRIVPGEKVYLLCSTDGKHRGTGYVTGVNDINYLVSVTDGEFAEGEAVTVYRSSDFNTTTRLGRGTITRNGAVGYTGTGEAVSIGSSTTTSSSSRSMSSTTTETADAAAADDSSTPQSLVSLLVADGQEVSPGTPLFTVSTADAYAQSMTAPVAGIVTETAVTAGTAVSPGMAIVTIAPSSAMRLALHVPERDLASLSLGSTVAISFLSGEVAEGTIVSLQGLAEEAEESEEADDDEETFFTVYVSFPATDTIAYGMTGKVTIED